jgi:Protein of unknown function (DUF3866)
MASFRTGKVVEIVESAPDLVRVRVAVDDGEIAASAFPKMLGPLAPGDTVVVNTTGLDLGLGTGGEGFVLWNLDGHGPERPGPGHIVKLRYTPWQTEVLAAEAPESPHHAVLRDATGLDGMPVIACGLHSQIAGVAAGIKAARPRARVGYLMTDGAALPIAWSRLVAELTAAQLIDVTCTAGHAFGGELEAVNIFSGLLALRYAGRADAAIVAMGPGVVGTGTALGFTAMEQGQVLDAASALGGRAIACLRISFADERDRHRGLSHHDIAALTTAARERATLVVPELEPERAAFLRRQLEAAELGIQHAITFGDGEPGLKQLETRGIRPRSMGRDISEVRELFLAAAAAGEVAARTL